MKPTMPRSTCQAFTLIELLVVGVIIGVMIAMLCPVNHGTRSKASTIACMNNLKQAGIGFLMYASDHADQYPWQRSTNAAATTEDLGLRAASECFLVLSNYAFPPHILVCPSDKARIAATNYVNFNNPNLSYFAAISTTVATSRSNAWQVILAGDRHLSVAGQPVRPGLCTLNSKTVPDWTTEMHKSESKENRGNLLFADGHGEVVSQLSVAFSRQPVAMTRLLIP